MPETGASEAREVGHIDFVSALLLHSELEDYLELQYRKFLPQRSVLRYCCRDPLVLQLAFLVEQEIPLKLL